MPIRDTVARRSNYEETLDFFPTPAYATRALFEYVMDEDHNLGAESMWDPAAGAGHMCRVFEEYQPNGLFASDIKDYGRYSKVEELSIRDAVMEGRHADHIITNPPYADMADFVDYGLRASKKTLSLLTRIQFLEGQKRYKKIFDVRPPTTVAVFSDRIPFKQNVTTKKVSKMFTHCWVHWDHHHTTDHTKLIWLPPDILDKLEKDGDWDE